VSFYSAAENLRRWFDPRYLTAFLSTAHANRGLERYRRAGITASTSFLSKGLTILISLVSVPLTVRYLGTERYGVWLTISSLLTWMALTDFGLAGYALVNVIAEADGRDDRKLAREYASSAFWSLIAISGILTLAIALSLHFIPLRSVFRVSAAISTQELYLACVVSLIVFAFNMPLNMSFSIYSAYQDGFAWHTWTMASNVLALIGLVVVTQFRGGLAALVAGTFGARVIVGIVNLVYVFASRYPWLRPAFAAVHCTRIKRLMSLGGKYMVTELANLGIQQSQPLIITQLLGPSKVTIFVIAYRIISLPLELSHLGTLPFVSAFAEARARYDWKWIRSAFKNASVACLFAGVPVSIAIAAASKFLVGLLAGSQAVPEWSVIIWLTIYTLTGMTFVTAGQALCGLERVGVFAVSQSCAAVLTISLGIVLAYEWGLAGVAAGMAIATLSTYGPLQGYRIHRLLHRSPAESRPTETEAMVA
jgi:O-antigen/teichoic acid export membrane protein